MQLLLERHAVKTSPATFWWLCKLLDIERYTVNSYQTMDEKKIYLFMYSRNQDNDNDPSLILIEANFPSGLEFMRAL